MADRADLPYPAAHLTTTQRVPFGHRVTVHGLLTTVQGALLAGVHVEIVTAPANGLDQFAPAAAATTSADGSWMPTLAPEPSRLIRADYGGGPQFSPPVGSRR